MRVEEDAPLDKKQRIEDMKAYYPSVFTYVFISLCIFFGVVGNKLVFFYYTCISRGGSTGILALALVSFQLLSCLVMMPLQIYISSLTYAFRPQDASVCKVFWGVQMLGVGGGAWLVAVFTYEMQRKVFLPFSLPSLDRKRVLSEVGIGVILAVVISVPALFLSGISILIDREATEIEKEVCFLDRRHVGTTFAMVYHSIASAGLVAVTCFVIIVNLRISGTVYRPQTPTASVSSFSTSLSPGRRRGTASARVHLLEVPPRYQHLRPSTAKLSREPSFPLDSRRSLGDQLQVHNPPVSCTHPPLDQEVSKTGASSMAESDVTRRSVVPGSSLVSSPSSSNLTEAEQRTPQAGCFAGLRRLWARAFGTRDNRLRPMRSADARSPPLTSAAEISGPSVIFPRRVQPANPSAVSGPQPRSQNVPRDSITSDQARSTARCTLCLISILVAVQYLPYAIFMVEVAVTGWNGVKKLWVVNFYVPFQLAYRSIFIGCTVNPYAFFVSDNRFRLCMERCRLKIRPRHKLGVRKVVGPLTYEDGIEADRLTPTERMETSF